MNARMLDITRPIATEHVALGPDHRLAISAYLAPRPGSVVELQIERRSDGNDWHPASAGVRFPSARLHEVVAGMTVVATRGSQAALFAP